MVQIITLQAPESLGLHEMSLQEIEAYVDNVASHAVDSLPEGIRPAGVNAVKIEALRSGVGSKQEASSQWERACAAQQ